MVQKGDTAWLLFATVLVMLMIVPGLALFYGGLVRAKNILSVLMQVLVVASLALVLWVLYGYSLAFDAGNAWIGGIGKAMLAGVGPESTVATFTPGVAVPELAYVAFQGAFAAISCALVVGAIAERAKFAAVPVVRRDLVHLRLPSPRAHGVGGGRSPVPHGCARFRGRHGGAYQCGRRGPGRCVHARAAHRFRTRTPVAPQPAADVRRCVVAVGGVVRFQRGIGAGSQWRCGAGVPEHLAGGGRRGAGVERDRRRCCAAGRRCSAQPRVPSRDWWRSRRRAARSASAAPS